MVTITLPAWTVWLLSVSLVVYVISAAVEAYFTKKVFEKMDEEEGYWQQVLSEARKKWEDGTEVQHEDSY